MCSGALLFFSHGQVHSDLIPFSAWGLQAGRGLAEGYRLCLALTLPGLCVHVAGRCLRCCACSWGLGPSGRAAK